MNQCKTCGIETANQKFCSRSCAAKHNNKGVRRHGSEPNLCIVCKESTRNAKYCSRDCSAKDRKKDPKSIAASNAARQARYRAKHGYNRAYAPGADREAIKTIYENCPDGYEVDHIVPLSKGGLHHQDNLQHLTVADNRRKGNRTGPPFLK
tara:strand:- start:27 stop:479 length:453 start_codon:yes stop_codon:yes gene_type:complete